MTYASARERSLEETIDRFIDRGPELQRAAAARASEVRSMNMHFAELFSRYERIVPAPAFQPAATVRTLDPLPEVALARSVASRS